MRKLTTVGVAVLASTLLLSAIPQDAAPARAAMKYGDRCQAYLGKRFYVGTGTTGTEVLQAAKGPYRLVAVGLDFAEFDSEDDRVLIPLAALKLREEKPGK